jgi:hypothetical protein
MDVTRKTLSFCQTAKEAKTKAMRRRRRVRPVDIC